MLRSPSHQRRLGYSGSWTNGEAGVSKLSNAYFKVLLGNTWEPTKSAAGKSQLLILDCVYIHPLQVQQHE
jgi:catalase (peroxidase I)